MKFWRVQGAPDPPALPGCSAVKFDSFNLHSGSKNGSQKFELRMLEHFLIDLFCCSQKNQVWDQWNWHAKLSKSFLTGTNGSQESINVISSECNRHSGNLCLHHNSEVNKENKHFHWHKRNLQQQLGPGGKSQLQSMLQDLGHHNTEQPNCFPQVRSTLHV